MPHNIDKHVLSIQSHVVHGYVGNKCSQFTLQAHEYEIDIINSVQFSNHTGYDVWKGDILNEKQLSELYQGLKQNKLNKYSHLLTGYSRSVSFLMSVVDILNDLREHNKDLVYICDPVMGDDGAFYVPETLLPVYRDILAPVADVLTPNQFELQVLSGVDVDTEINLVKALRILHMRGTKRIVVTSTKLAPDAKLLYVYSSEQNNDGYEVHRFEVPRYPVSFLGTGDLFSSLLLVWLDKKRGLVFAVESVLSCIHGVLENTYQYAKSRAQNLDKLSFADLELRLVTSRKELLDPAFLVKICPIDASTVKSTQK